MCVEWAFGILTRKWKIIMEHMDCHCVPFWMLFLHVTYVDAPQVL